MKLTKENLYNLIQEEVQKSALRSILAKSDMPGRYALLMVSEGKKLHFMLYQLPPLESKVVAYAQIQPTSKPCIPPTYEVALMARDTDNDYRGLGGHMYDLVASYVGAVHDGGITSDHDHSSSVAAYKVWQKLLNSGKYIKRKTQIGGNDKFDYNKSTPGDPADDCDQPKGDEYMSSSEREDLVAASDYSLQIKAIHKNYMDWMENHDKAIEVAYEVMKQKDGLGDISLDQVKDAAERKIFADGKKLFNDVYFDKDVKKLTKGYFGIWNTIKRAITGK